MPPVWLTQFGRDRAVVPLSLGHGRLVSSCGQRDRRALPRTATPPSAGFVARSTPSNTQYLQFAGAVLRGTHARGVGLQRAVCEMYVELARGTR